MNALLHFPVATRVALVASALLLASCEQAVLPAGGFAARAQLEPDVVQVGDVVTLTFTARHAPGSAVSFPALGRGKEIVVRGRARETTLPAKGVLQTEETIRFSSLRPGEWLITTNAATCTFSDGRVATQTFPRLQLRVESALDESNATTLSDIKGPIRPIALIVGVIALIVALALFVGLLTRHRRRRPGAKPLPIVAPHKIAGDALHALKQEEWTPEPFFVALSQILRTYLAGRYNLHAPESTTEELTRELPSEHQALLSDFFEQADLVKFARADAQQDVMQTAFSTVESFVHQTRPETTE